jgi:hypothetical protein
VFFSPQAASRPYLYTLLHDDDDDDEPASDGAHAGCATPLWVGRQRYVWVDLTAAPTTWGPHASGPGVVLPSTLPRPVCYRPSPSPPSHAPCAFVTLWEWSGAALRQLVAPQSTAVLCLGTPPAGRVSTPADPRTCERRKQVVFSVSSGDAAALLAGSQLTMMGVGGRCYHGIMQRRDMAT